CCHGLRRAVSGRGTPDDLRGPIEVVAHCKFRTGTGFKSRQRGKRHHVTRPIPNIELPYVLRPIAIGTLGLDVHLPLPAKPVEVVDERASHERLNGAINILDVNPLFEHFVSIDSDELLRHPWQECSVDCGEFRTLPGCCKELVQIVSKKFHLLSRAVLENEREAPRGSHARNRRRRKRERNALRETSKFPV